MNPQALTLVARRSTRSISVSNELEKRLLEQRGSRSDRARGVGDNNIVHRSIVREILEAIIDHDFYTRVGEEVGHVREISF